MKPPFAYFGGKQSVAGQIAALLPPHEHYVEPFAGSCAVLLAKPPSGHETVNDLDQDLMTFFRVLRDDREALERVCALTPHSRAEHEACYDRDGVSDLERARRVWVVLTQGRGGMMRRTGWRFYRDPRGSSAGMPGHLAAYLGRFAPVAQRLAGVSLECKPALDVIREYGQHPGCLIYADPPYLASLRTLNNGRGRGPDYAHEFRTDAEHKELAEALNAARAAVVLSGYGSPLYGELYAGWHRTEIRTTAGNAAGERARVEVVWSNRPFPQESLFSLTETGAAS